jgi:hypothetical protein
MKQVCRAPTTFVFNHSNVDEPLHLVRPRRPFDHFCFGDVGFVSMMNSLILVLRMMRIGTLKATTKKSSPAEIQKGAGIPCHSHDKNLLISSISSHR